MYQQPYSGRQYQPGRDASLDPKTALQRATTNNNNVILREEYRLIGYISIYVPGPWVLNAIHERILAAEGWRAMFKALQVILYCLLTNCPGIMTWFDDRRVHRYASVIELQKSDWFWRVSRWEYLELELGRLHQFSKNQALLAKERAEEHLWHNTLGLSPDEAFQLFSMQTKTGIGFPKPNQPSVPVPNTFARPNHPIAWPNHPLARPGYPLAGPGYPLAGPGYPLAGPGYPLAGPNHPLARPGYPLAGPNHPLARPGYPLAGPGYPLAGPNHPLAGPSYPLARPNHHFVGPTPGQTLTELRQPQYGNYQLVNHTPPSNSHPLPVLAASPMHPYEAPGYHGSHAGLQYPTSNTSLGPSPILEVHNAQDNLQVLSSEPLAPAGPVSTCSSSSAASSIESNETTDTNDPTDETGSSDSLSGADTIAVSVGSNETKDHDPSVTQSFVSDLVRDSKLQARFLKNGNILHTSSLPYRGNNQRRREHRQEWKETTMLGQGTFGDVHLQECVSGGGGIHNANKGPNKPRQLLRAVKSIRKTSEGTIDYNCELEAIAKFSHINYVRCFVRSFGWYEIGNTMYITMEYFKCGSLEKYIERPLPEAEVREITSQILEGLSFMHENKFIHRDLKPANILVRQPSPGWWVKISDFGLSKRAKWDSSVAFHSVVGTRNYFAPELLDESKYTVAVDLWALGAVAYQLLTTEVRRVRPFAQRRTGFPIEPLLRRQVSRECLSLLEKMLALDPTTRPSATKALMDRWICDEAPDGDCSSQYNSQYNSGGKRTSIFRHPTRDMTSEASASWPTQLG